MMMKMIVCMKFGSLFHAAGPANANARFPNFPSDCATKEIGRR